MFLIQVLGSLIVVGGSFYAGSKYGSRGMAALKAELVGIENDAKNALKVEKTAINSTVDRIKLALHI